MLRWLHSSVRFFRKQKGAMTLFGSLGLIVSSAAIVSAINVAKVQFQHQSMYMSAKSAAMAALQSEQDIFDQLTNDIDLLGALQGNSDDLVQHLLDLSDVDNLDYEMLFGTVSNTNGHYTFTPFISQVRPFLEKPTAVTIKLTKETMFGTDIESNAIYTVASNQSGGACYSRLQECIKDTNNENYCRYGHLDSIYVPDNNTTLGKYPYLGLTLHRDLGQEVLTETTPSALLNVNLSLAGLSLLEKNLVPYPNHTMSSIFKSNTLADWLDVHSHDLDNNLMNQYYCTRLLLGGLLTVYTQCTTLDVNANVSIHFNGNLYVGYQSTCIDGQTAPDKTKCLSTDELKSDQTYPSDFKEKLANGGEYSGILTVPESGQTYYALTSCLTINGNEDYMSSGQAPKKGIFLPVSF